MALHRRKDIRITKLGKFKKVCESAALVPRRSWVPVQFKPGFFLSSSFSTVYFNNKLISSLQWSSLFFFRSFSNSDFIAACNLPFSDYQERWFQRELQGIS